MTQHFLISSFHDSILLLRISRREGLLYTSHTTQIFNQIVVKGGTSIGVNHFGGTKATEMLKQALRCFERRGCFSRKQLDPSRKGIDQNQNVRVTPIILSERAGELLQMDCMTRK